MMLEKAYYILIFCILTAIRMISSTTLTFVMTASQILVMPLASRISTFTFITKPTIVFCYTICRIIFPIWKADAIFKG